MTVSFINHRNSLHSSLIKSQQQLLKKKIVFSIQFLSFVHNQLASWKKNASVFNPRKLAIAYFQRSWERDEQGERNYTSCALLEGKSAKRGDYEDITYYKCGLGKDDEEEDKFDAGLFEESVKISWDMRQKK